MKLHHIGVIVDNIEKHGGRYAETAGFGPQGPVLYDPAQKVMVQFWGAVGQTPLELILPVGPDSPSYRALQKGGGLNHLAFEVDDLDRRVTDAVSKGAICTCAPVPAVAFGGRRVAFVFQRDIGLLEFLEARA